MILVKILMKIIVFIKNRMKINDFGSWALRGPMGSPMEAPLGARGSIRVKNYMHELPIHRNAAILVFY